MSVSPSTATLLFPKTLQEACILQGTSKTRGRLIAGGTDLMAQWAAGVPVPERVISIRGLPELCGIDVSTDVVEIGAGVTHAEIRDCTWLRPHVPALVAASSSVGARQIQASGTLGGNAANASPAGDTAPALLITDGLVLLASKNDGWRTVPLTAFWTDYRKIAARPDEIVASFILPKKGVARERFRKIGARRAQAISTIMAASRIRVRKNVIECAALALGSVAATPIRLTAVETWLQGRPLTPKLGEEAAALTRDSVTPIDDIRCGADYRRWAAGQLVLDAIDSLRRKW